MANIDTINANRPVTPLPTASRAQPSGTTNAGGNELPLIGASGGKAEAPAQPTTQQVEQVVAKLSDFVQSVQRDLSFTVDDNTGSTVIIVRDSQTDQVVRQIPSEELLQLAQNLNELQEKLNESKGNLLEVRV